MAQTTQVPAAAPVPVSPKTLEDPELKKILLFSAFVHFLIGIITLLLAIFLGATITEAILAVWELFCAIVGFSSLCVHKSPRIEAVHFASFSRIYIKVYCAMTIIGAMLGASAFLHGTYVLIRTSMMASNYPTTVQNAIPSWFVILGASNLAIGLGTAIVDSIICHKLLAYERARLQASSPAPQCSSVACSTITFPTAPPNYQSEISDAPAVFPSEPPPSYELAIAMPPTNPNQFSQLPEKTS